MLVGAFLGAACSLACVSVDSQVSEALRGWDVPGDLEKAINLSEAFAHGTGAAAILISVLVIAEAHRKAVLFAVILTIASGLLANGAKSAFVRVRPHSVDHIVVEDVSGSIAMPSGARAASDSEIVSRDVVFADFWDARQRSFPSGHAATAWGLAIGLSLVFPRGVFIFAMLAVLACVQRLTSGAHFPSDVFAGAAIAFLCCLVLLWLPMTRKLLDDDSSGQRIVPN